jgi:polyferredoxin
MRGLRTAVQLVFLGGVVALFARGLAGATPNTCEYYCPFGGLVALYPLVRYKAYTCSLTELNVSLLVSLVVLTVATKKSFCSWICPLGTVQEWIGRVGGKLFGRRFHPPARPDRALMILRYVVLALVVALTYTLILVGFLAAALFVPFLWCRYACPLGATIDPLSRAGALRIRRNRDRCTECGSCDAICPHRIPVSQVAEVTARNCTNCLECIEGCPESGALELSWFGK